VIYDKQVECEVSASMEAGTHFERHIENIYCRLIGYLNGIAICGCGSVEVIKYI